VQVEVGAMSHAAMTIDVHNRLAELDRVRQLVEAFGQAHRLPDRTRFELDLVLDEVLTNIVSYGYSDADDHVIVVRLSMAAHREGSEISVDVEDDGRPFDLTAASGPPLDLPIEQRPIGGLGIHLVRQLMDQLAYRRQQGRNVLSMKKLLRDRLDGGRQP
jgi:serine/threonine-protein kinase RsbW